MLALPPCSTGDWLLTISTRAARTSSSAAGATLTWTSTPRAVATGEYLSSYVYREAFAESFALAVASQVTSSAFITHNDAGRSASLRFDRYQNFEGITQVGNTYDTPQIRILHVPSLDFDTIEQSLPGTPAALERG